jgi:hypothetical protein
MKFKQLIIPIVLIVLAIVNLLIVGYALFDSKSTGVVFARLFSIYVLGISVVYATITCQNQKDRSWFGDIVVSAVAWLFILLVIILIQIEITQSNFIPITLEAMILSLIVISEIYEKRLFN